MSEKGPWQAFRRVLSRWQELAVWVPVTVALLLVAHWLIPYLDPRSGIDGWGVLWGILLVVLAAVVAAFLAWLFEVAYSYELDDATERELIDHACGIDRGRSGDRIGAGPATWQAVAVLALYRVRWLALFWLLFSRLAP